MDMQPASRRRGRAQLQRYRAQIANTKSETPVSNDSEGAKRSSEDRGTTRTETIASAWRARGQLSQPSSAITRDKSQVGGPVEDKRNFNKITDPNIESMRRSLPPIVPEPPIQHPLDNGALLHKETSHTQYSIAELLRKYNVNDIHAGLISAAMHGRIEDVQLLLDRGASDLDGALRETAHNGRVDIAQLLLDRGAIDLDGALKTAAHNDRLDIVQLLLHRGASNLDSALREAAHNGRVDIAQLLLDRGATDLDDALKTATYHGSTNLVRLFLHRGAKDLDGALKMAAYKGWVNIAQLLLDRGAIDLDSALKMAAYKGCLEIAQLLLDHGASDLDGALREAAHNDRLDIVQLLLDHGAKDLDGALKMAVHNGWLDIAQLLLNHGATDLDDALKTAARNDRLDIVQLLLDHGATDLDGALKEATRNDRLDIVQLLLDHGASYLDSALKTAAHNGWLDIAQLLLDHGATDLDGALKEAACNDRLDIVQLLLDRGATVSDGLLKNTTQEGHSHIAKPLIGGLKTSTFAALACNSAMTDSGYASLYRPLQSSMSQVPRAGTASNECGKKIANASRVWETSTEFSEASSEVDNLALRTLSAICEDLHNSLRDCIDTATFQPLVHTLPDLLRAFALKIGADQSNSKHLQIMRFVYQQNRRIITNLQAMFTDDPTEESRAFFDGQNNMPVGEKMMLWHAKSTEKPSILKLEDWNPPEVEDVVLNEAPDSDYHNIIQNSDSYRWLLESIRRESSMRHGVGNFDTMAGQIRRTVLSELRMGTISSKEPPRTFSVKIRLPLWPTKDWLSMGSPEDQLSSPSRISRIRILVCPSLTDMQVTDVGEYMRQTWEDDSSWLLDIVDKVLLSGHACGPVSVPGPFKNGCKVAIEGNQLVITTTGLAYSIAQCAEQIAFVGTALQCPGLSAGAAHQPSIIKTAEREFLVQYRVDRHLSESLTPLIRSAFWGAAPSRDWNIVPLIGYPISSRAEDFPGIEILSSMIPALGITCKVVFASKRVELIGEKTTMELQKTWEEGGRRLSFWHVTRSVSWSCLCPLHGCDNRVDIVANRVPFNPLERQRYIIEKCPGKALGSQSLLYESTIPRFFPRVGLDNDQGARSDDQVAHDQETVTPDVSLATSLDSDMLSISSSSSDSADNPLFMDDALLALVRAVASRLFNTCHFAGSPGNFSEPCDGGDRSNAGSNSTEAVRIAPRIQGCRSSGAGSDNRKRKRSQEEDDNNSDHEDRPHRNSHTHQIQAPPGKYFACPFWKLDPMRHVHCCKMMLSTCSQVKQHLTRKHTPKYHCQRCLKFFDTKARQREHWEEPQCTVHPIGTTSDGIVEDQSKTLSKRSKGNTSEARWYEIWDILFPRNARPASPYVDNRLPEALIYALECWNTRGSGILDEELRAIGVAIMDPTPLSQLRDRIQDEIVNRFLDGSMIQQPDSPSNSFPGSSIHHARRGARGTGAMSSNTTVHSSTADSGVGLSSHGIVSDSLERHNQQNFPALTMQTHELGRSDLAASTANEVQGGHIHSPARPTGQIQENGPDHVNNPASDGFIDSEWAPDVEPSLQNVPDIVVIGDNHVHQFPFDDTYVFQDALLVPEHQTSSLALDSAYADFDMTWGSHENDESGELGD
ncbi:hypothetical protein GQ53DRAFT_828418 [Thozetella sp. PMI_491]|nr:hypothetical protein GQ53DRAFT_828418 [Thozetella sp. PMI_491]